jgi:protein involved in polysaccharide export with SLBB domain
MEVSLVRAGIISCVAVLISAASLPAQIVSTNATNAAVNAVAPRAAAGTSRALDDHHRLRPGDKLSFRVAEDGEDAKPLTVTDLGEIELPYGFGRFAAANKTCRALAQEIKVALEKDYYKRATVHLGLDAINNVRGKAYVSGQVSKPGPVSIPVDAPLKLSQAILIAGPPTQWAKLSAVKVVRQGGKDTQTFIVDVDAILNKGRPEKDVVLEPDDLVIVPERGVLVGG